MEARQESLSSLRELLRRAGRDGGKDAEGDYRLKPQNGSDAPAQNVTAIPQEVGQAGPRPDDWSGTLDLVLRASEKLVASDERVRDLEVEVRELTESASKSNNFGRNLPTFNASSPKLTQVVGTRRNGFAASLRPFANASTSKLRRK
jgi:hypothetical protein